MTTAFVYKWSHLPTEKWYIGSNHPAFGTKHSEESKKIRSEKLKGRIPWNKGKKSIKIEVINELKIR